MFKKLPQFVFVRKEKNGDGTDDYLLAFEESADAIEDDGPTLVGTYQLKETLQLSKRVFSLPRLRRTR